jgi:CHASE2 domain-containing sensor protein
MDTLLGRVLFVVIVAVPSMGACIMLVRGVQGIRQFGWNSPHGVWYWSMVLAGLYGAYVTSHLVDARPLALTAVAIGLVGGGLLSVAVKPRWPTRTPGVARSALILAFTLGILVWLVVTSTRYPPHPLEGGELIGIVLLAF